MEVPGSRCRGSVQIWECGEAISPPGPGCLSRAYSPEPQGRSRADRVHGGGGLRCWPGLPMFSGPGVQPHCTPAWNTKSFHWFPLIARGGTALPRYRAGGQEEDRAGVPRPVPPHWHRGVGCSLTCTPWCAATQTVFGDWRGRDADCATLYFKNYLFTNSNFLGRKLRYPAQMGK